MFRYLKWIQLYVYRPLVFQNIFLFSRNLGGSSSNTLGTTFNSELPHIPATDIDDIISRKLFLKSNQYIKNYEEGLREHREKGRVKRLTKSLSKKMENSSENDDFMEDHELFDPLK